MANIKSGELLLILTVFCGIILNISCQESGNDDDSTAVEFTPQVSAICKAGVMNIKVLFAQPYSGAVHARDYRNPYCMVHGNGSTSVMLSLNLVAKQPQNDYCGILVSNTNSDQGEERSVQLAVRVHKTLELADDKFYVITCGKNGFGRDENSQVSLKFLENDRRVRETVYGRTYTIKVELTQPNGTNGILVRNCFAFNKKNNTVPLIDNRGCPIDSAIISKFQSKDGDLPQATAVLNSMFKFPQSSEVHLQCDVLPCMGACKDDVICGNDPNGIKGGNAGGYGQKKDENMLLAATTIFVLDPAEAPLVSTLCDDTGVRPPWLLWLTIALGVLFLIMLLMNIFLCTAMSCSCARTEIIEKEPSIIEEYDPYRSWHGSQYGSRFSLHGRDGHNKGYTSGGSTIHSNRSISNNNDYDHYAIVHSRPGSRSRSSNTNNANR